MKIKPPMWKFLVSGILMGGLIAHFASTAQWAKEFKNKIATEGSHHGIIPQGESWEHHLRAAEQENKKRAESEFSRMDRERAPIFSITSPDGKLNERAIELAHLTAAEADACQKILNEERTKAGEDFASRATLDKRLTNEETGILVYQIRAAPDRGTKALEYLKNAFSNSVGSEKTDILMNGIDETNFILGSRKDDVQIEFDQTKGTFTFSHFNPATGYNGGSRTEDIKKFPLFFGDSFDLNAESK